MLRARFIGTAKPKPSAPTSAVAIAVVIPINSPLLLINAPPLEPLVIGASVCIRPNYVTPLPIVSLPTSRRLASAETTPEVTVGAAPSVNG